MDLELVPPARVLESYLCPTQDSCLLLASVAHLRASFCVLFVRWLARAKADRLSREDLSRRLMILAVPRGLICS